jgi:hypothetical protein
MLLSFGSDDLLNCSSMASVYSWVAVYEWDKKYRVMRAERCLRWNTDLPMLSMYLREEDRLESFVSGQKRQRLSNGSSNRGNRSTQRDFGACFAWNTAGGCKFSLCKYKHVCKKCGGAHTRDKCTSSSSGSSGTK